MQKYLVKYSANWADELNVYGLAILTEDDKKYIEEFNSFPVTNYIGTNEEIKYKHQSTFLSDYNFTLITEQEEVVLSKFIGHSYGHFFYPEEVLDDADIEEDCEDDPDDYYEDDDERYFDNDLSMEELQEQSTLKYFHMNN